MVLLGAQRGGVLPCQQRLQLLREAMATNSDEAVREAMHKVVPTYKTPEEVNCRAGLSKEMQNVRKISE